MSGLHTLQIPEELSVSLGRAAFSNEVPADSLVEEVLRSNLCSRVSRLTQISSSAALVQGVLQGAISSSLLLASGDLGVGTFSDLDGEMVILNGAIYQVLADGAPASTLGRSTT